VLQKINAPIGVAPFVVVPTDQFKKTTVEFDAGAGIEDTRVRIVQEIG
jgi:hypothetical protein